MLALIYANQFKVDFKKIAKLPIADVMEVGQVIKQLQLGETLPEGNKFFLQRRANTTI